MKHPAPKKRTLATGQLRRTFSNSSINPYKLYSTGEIKIIGKWVDIDDPRRLVNLRRQLRDTASTCIRFRDEFARSKTPSERQTWLCGQIIKPSKHLRQSITKLMDPKNGYVQDLQQVLPQTESLAATHRFLQDLEGRLLKLERLTEAAYNELSFTGQQLPKAKYFERIVEEFSQVYLNYMSSSSVGLNKRYPEHNSYMQFIRKSTKPLIGHEHGLMEQMKKFRDTLKT